MVRSVSQAIGGQAVNALLFDPQSAAVDSAGNVYIAGTKTISAFA